MKVNERELSIDFVGCQVDEIDRRAGGRCDCMKFVDFVVSTPDKESLLVELTDPSGTTVPAAGREDFRRTVGKGDLVMECVQKARGTYCYLHLMNRCNRNRLFVLLIGDDHPDLKLDKAQFSTLQDAIVKKTRHEGLEPWRLSYLDGVVVLGISDWNKLYPHYHLERIAAAPGVEPEHA